MRNQSFDRDGGGRYDGGNNYGGIAARKMNQGFEMNRSDRYDGDGGNNYGGMMDRMTNQGYDMEIRGRYGGGDMNYEEKKYSGTGSGSRKLTSVRGRKVHH